MIWFTSDNHFSHANILGYCDRPFANVEEMDQAMIDNWNEVVGDDDVIYHLGDFTLGHDAEKYFNRLNGRIHILGTWWHHDKRWIAKTRGRVFDFGNTNILSASEHPVKLLPPLYLVKSSNVPPITLSHYPMAHWEQSHRGAWCLHGHSHGTYKADGLIMDVGVDANNFYPVSIIQVAAQMKEKAGS